MMGIQLDYQIATSFDRIHLPAYIVEHLAVHHKVEGSYSQGGLWIGKQWAISVVALYHQLPFNLHDRESALKAALLLNRRVDWNTYNPRSGDGWDDIWQQWLVFQENQRRPLSWFEVIE